MSYSRFPGVGPERLARRGFLFGVAALGVGALAACSGSSTASNGSAATAAARVNSGLNAEKKAVQSANAVIVKMTDQNTFDPATVTIPTGGTVTWQNTSSTVHSATFDPSKVSNAQDVQLPSGVQPFDSGLIQPGQSWSHTFTVAGTYKYTCIPHESLGMHGTVIVK